MIYIDDSYLNERRKQWILGDSIAKYCTSNELEELAIFHKSQAIRYVAFQLLLKKNPHRAVNILINDIDNNDSIIAIQFDEGFPRLIASLKVDLVQGGRKQYNISIKDSIAVDEAVLKSKNKSKFHYYPYLQKRLFPQKE